MSNDLDELNARDPLSLTKADIAKLVAEHRAARARRAAGEKITKPKQTGSVDISSITEKLIKESKPAPTITRRI